MLSDVASAAAPLESSALEGAVAPEGEGSTLIVYCHPYEGSFCHAILERLTARYERDGVPYQVIDLHADGFDPGYSTEEMALFSRGETLDPLVTRYQGMLRAASRLVLIAPIWWNDVPAQLKGWFDKVMKKDFAYRETPQGLVGLLTNIREELVYTTSANPTEFLATAGGDGIERVLIGATFAQLGFGPGRWVNFGGIDASTPEQRAAYLAQVG